jgi:hypothetical protein
VTQTERTAWLAENLDDVRRLVHHFPEVRRRYNELVSERSEYSEANAHELLRAARRTLMGVRDKPAPSPPIPSESPAERARAKYERNPSRDNLDRYAHTVLRERVWHPELPSY